MKISYVTSYSTSDIGNWSGLGYFIPKALTDQNAELDIICTPKVEAGFVLSFKKMLYRMLGQDFDLTRAPGLARQSSRYTSSLIKPDSNIIFSPGSIPIALLETEKPKVFYTDATFAGMIGFYEGFSNFCPETIKNGNYLEREALESAKLVIYSSDWAANSAIKHYHIDPSKIKVVPFGANINCRLGWKDLKQLVDSRSSTECNLLFVGVEWVRKGGDAAVAIADMLNKTGVKSKLHIVGARDVPSNLPDFVVNHGFISKATQEGQRRIERLFSQSHFLLLPTKADCTPVVFSEANSFGVPVISTNVGGISTVIKDDVNGRIFSLNSDLTEWCNYIYATFCNKQRYYELCVSSFGEFQNRLNWNSAGESVMKLLKEL